MLDGFGLRGLSLLEEVYDEAGGSVESFFDEYDENVLAGQVTKAASAEACVQLVGPEYAVVDPLQHPVGQLGTSGLEHSVAVFLATPNKSRVGLAHIDKASSAAAAVLELARQVQAGDWVAGHDSGPSPGRGSGSSRNRSRSRSRSSSSSSNSNSSSSTSSTSSSLSSSSLSSSRRPKRARGAQGGATRRAGRGTGESAMEAFVVGGYRDEAGVCEGILREVLAGLMRADVKITVRLFCAGLMNDSSHNGNEEDQRGPRCALVTAAVMRIALLDGGAEVRFELAPVVGFARCGAAAELRRARLFFCPAAATPAPSTAIKTKIKIKTKTKTPLPLAYDLETGEMVVAPFRLTVPDVQTLVLLLHFAERDGDDDAFPGFPGPGPIGSARRAAHVRDLEAMLRFLLRPEAPTAFAKGPLRFAFAKGSWQPVHATMAPGLRSAFAGSTTNNVPSNVPSNSNKSNGDVIKSVDSRPAKKPRVSLSHLPHPHAHAPSVSTMSS